MPVAEPLLRLEGLTVRFGGLTAVEDLDLQAHAGEVLGLIGPNGAGKTTVFNAITGIYAPTSGRVAFAGKPLVRRFRPQLAALWALLAALFALGGLLCGANVDRLWAVGIKQHYDGRTFDGAAAWQDVSSYLRAEPRLEARMGRLTVVSYDGGTSYLSTRDAAAAQARLQAVWSDALTTPAAMGFRRGHVAWGLGGAALGVGFGAAFFGHTRRTPGWIARQGLARTFQNNRVFARMTVWENVQVALDRRGAALDKTADHWLEFVGLAAHARTRAGDLPYGDQRRLEIARALATQPRLLLLDEPAAGMNPTETRALTALIGRIRALGVAILLIEHDMRLVMQLSDRIAVLEYGRKIAEGPPSAVRANPAVIAAYLGEETPGEAPDA